MLRKQVKNYLFINAGRSPCELRSRLDYERGQCAE